MDPGFYDVVVAASRRPEVRQAVGRLYDEVEAEVRRRRPVCELSGRCCRFEDYGHRLYVTTMELAAFLHDYQNRRKSGELIDSVMQWDGRGCPFQLGKLCGLHEHRPFGCRMFFCDPAAAQWQNEQYERSHANLKRLHEQYGVPYEYVEWRQALERLGLTVRRPTLPQ